MQSRATLVIAQGIDKLFDILMENDTLLDYCSGLLHDPKRGPSVANRISMIFERLIFLKPNLSNEIIGFLFLLLHFTDSLSVELLFLAIAKGELGNQEMPSKLKMSGFCSYLLDLIRSSLTSPLMRIFAACLGHEDLACGFESRELIEILNQCFESKDHENLEAAWDALENAGRHGFIQDLVPFTAMSMECLCNEDACHQIRVNAANLLSLFVLKRTDNLSMFTGEFFDRLFRVFIAHFDSNFLVDGILHFVFLSMKEPLLAKTAASTFLPAVSAEVASNYHSQGVGSCLHFIIKVSEHVSKDPALKSLVKHEDIFSEAVNGFLAEYRRKISMTYGGSTEYYSRAQWTSTF